MTRDDTRLAEAHGIPMEQVVDRLGIAGLRRLGAELVGPCPVCGGTDRFGVNVLTNVFQCRKECGPHAKGDQVSLVQLVLGKSFPEALEWLVGPRQELSPEERRALDARAAENRRRREEAARRAREQAILQARTVWARAGAAEGTLVQDYLARRGIPAPLLAPMPKCLRFVADLPFTVPVKGEAGRWRTIHTGPAMIAAVQDDAGRLGAVHRTWIDLDQPSGKARIVDPEGEHADLPAKKVLGSKKGGAIRLRSPAGATTMVMGEGIETTLSALVAEAVPGAAAFWAGVDLGNMAGRRRLGQGLRYAGLPDLADDEAFVPPAQIRKLVFVQDGDSDPKLTRAKLEAGLRRAMALRPGLTGAIVHAGEGRDLNDVLRGT
ncbi:DUF7146 domain-containing protein [Paracoccus aeridis]|uniref:DUF7146 domain-containing protein n=1 Tax=Paracoccus aeridis TaxID=1966466 RepID=UPI0010AA788D|nr:hypothetical protein [Paracoccus aeridis]